jgi:hypothetical protein
VWKLERSFQLQNSESANVHLPAKMSSQGFFTSKHFIAVAAMVAQCFLVGVFSTAVTTVMWSSMRDIPYVSKVLSKIWEVDMTLATIAMFCDLLMGLQVW